MTFPTIRRSVASALLLFAVIIGRLNGQSLHLLYAETVRESTTISSSGPMGQEPQPIFKFTHPDGWDGRFSLSPNGTPIAFNRVTEATPKHATSYKVFFGPNNPPYFATTTTNTSFAPGQLGSNTTYYWRVEAANAAGSKSSPLISFTTTTTPVSGPVLVPGLTNPNGIALDANFVYWIEFGGQVIRKVPKTGGTPITLFATPYNPSGLAVDDVNVYFGDGLNIRSVPKNVWKPPSSCATNASVPRIYRPAQDETHPTNRRGKTHAQREEIHWSVRQGTPRRHTGRAPRGNRSVEAHERRYTRPAIDDGTGN